jgi:hypothetical protein
MLMGPATVLFTITPAQIEDINLPEIASGIIIYRSGTVGSTDKPRTAELTVNNPGGIYSGISWYLDDNAVVNNASFTLDAANVAHNIIGKHFLTVMAVKDGWPYSKTITFEVRE